MNCKESQAPKQRIVYLGVSSTNSSVEIFSNTMSYSSESNHEFVGISQLLSQLVVHKEVDSFVGLTVFLLALESILHFVSPKFVEVRQVVSCEGTEFVDDSNKIDSHILRDCVNFPLHDLILDLIVDILHPAGVNKFFFSLICNFLCIYDFAQCSFHKSQLNYENCRLDSTM